MVDDVASVVPLFEDVDAADVWVPGHKSLLIDDNYTKKFNEFYKFLDNWVADQHAYGKTGGCPPPRKEEQSKEKSKRNKNKKGGSIRKATVIS